MSITWGTYSARVGHASEMMMFARLEQKYFGLPMMIDDLVFGYCQIVTGELDFETPRKTRVGRMIRSAGFIGIKIDFGYDFLDLPREERVVEFSRLIRDASWKLATRVREIRPNFDGVAFLVKVNQLLDEFMVSEYPPLPEFTNRLHRAIDAGEPLIPLLAQHMREREAREGKIKIPSLQSHRKAMKKRESP